VHRLGQGEVKRRAALPVGRGPQASAMRLDNPATDAQSHAAAICFCCEKRLENPLGFLYWKSDP
jgi:hypothetical protein